MSHALGMLIQHGSVVKIADDLYVGGDTGNEQLDNWFKVLSAFKHNGLWINAPKFVVFHNSTVVLGWNWTHGKLKEGPHRISSLATASPPKKVQGLRSFIDAYKVSSEFSPGVRL